MAKFLILVGTMDGHAVMAAKGAAAILNKLGHSSEMILEHDTSLLTRDKDEIILVCSSTAHQGQVPDNIFPLYVALDNQIIDLMGKYYGVIALGDSYFQASQFAMGGKLLENALYSCGAKRIGDMAVMDAQQVENHALAAALWTQEWVAKVESLMLSNSTSGTKTAA
ncbi:MAG: flavodoxin domain-containing protein [Pseudomonadota bacterium]